MNKLSSTRDLIDANVVDLHPRGKGRVVDALQAAPSSAHRDIEDQVLGCVERPYVVTAVHFTVELKVGLVVGADCDPVGSPGELIAMKLGARVRNRHLVSTRGVNYVI